MSARIKDFTEVRLTFAVAVWYLLPLAAGGALIATGTGSWRIGLGAVCLAVFVSNRNRK